jgi:hypothetical protein
LRGLPAEAKAAWRWFGRRRQEQRKRPTDHMLDVGSTLEKSS